MKSAYDRHRRPSPSQGRANRRIPRFVSYAGRIALDVLYPPRCLSCGDAIPAGNVLCARCFAGTVPFPLTHEMSDEHLASLTFYAPASAMYVGWEFEPEGAVEACIHAVKYRGLYRVGIWLGRVLGERLLACGLVNDRPLVIPVPLHRLKKVERGYNQAEMICRGVEWETRLACASDVLVRCRYTASQAAGQLGEEQRRNNVLNAFAVRPSRTSLLCGRSVLLVDDVITTGATIGECATVLREYGAVDVRLLAVARPPRTM
jgi:ComF family protein